mmetsp:Transcript_72624/g.194090  ORF Transcript_72624/g.194090 Transcript_72624/m.194090 type:complete len:224 (-) Transcript_72624:1049-1720(-)
MFGDAGLSNARGSSALTRAAGGTRQPRTTWSTCWRVLSATYLALPAPSWFRAPASRTSTSARPLVESLLAQSRTCFKRARWFRGRVRATLGYTQRNTRLAQRYLPPAASLTARRRENIPRTRLPLARFRAALRHWSMRRRRRWPGTACSRVRKWTTPCVRSSWPPRRRGRSTRACGTSAPSPPITTLVAWPSPRRRARGVWCTSRCRWDCAGSRICLAIHAPF